MNCFCIPYKAIIRKFIELDYVDEDAEEAYLKGFESRKALYKRLISENQYTKLERVNKACSMGTVEQDINLLEQNDIYSDKKIKRLRKLFHLERTKIDGADIYTYSDKRESLGEIRSLYMAMKKGYRYFMSDDADSKALAKNFFLTDIRLRS